MVSYRFIFNADQVKTINSIVIGLVEINKEKSSQYVPGYLISKSLGFLISFNIENEVKTVCIQSSCLKETSRLLTFNNKSIGIIGFNLGDYSSLDLHDFSNHTGLLFPGCVSKLYDDSRAIIAMGKNISSGTTQFNLRNLILNKPEEVTEQDINFFELKINKTFPLDIEMLGAYVLNMLQYSLAISNNWQANSSKRSIVLNELIVNAQKAQEQFSNYLSSLENNDTNVPTIKVVEQEAQKLLPPSANETNIVEETIVLDLNNMNTRKYQSFNDTQKGIINQSIAKYNISSFIKIPKISTNRHSGNPNSFLYKRPSLPKPILKSDSNQINTNTNANTNAKIMTNTNISAAPVVSNFVFAYNVNDINKETKIVKGSLTIPSAWVKQNASIIPACMWTFGKNKCIQFEYMGNIRIVKVDSTNPNALIKNVSKGNAPIFQLVFSLNLETKKEIRSKEVGQLPIVFYHSNNPVGERTEVAVREFNKEQFAVKALSLETILSNYSPILERDFFIKFCSSIKTEVKASVVLETIPVIEDKPAVVLKPVEKVKMLDEAVSMDPPKLCGKVEVVKLSKQDKNNAKAKKKAEKLASDNAKRAERAAKKAAKLAAQEDVNKMVKTDDQVKTEETVVNTNNTKENKIMDYRAISLMTKEEQIKVMETFAPEDFDAFAAYVAANEDEINRSVPVLNTNKNTEVKPMTSFQERMAAMQAQLDANTVETTVNERPSSFRNLSAMQAELNNNTNTEVKTMTAPNYDRSAALVDETEDDEEAYYAALDAQEDNTLAAANGQAKAEEIVVETTNTNSIPNNNTMDNVKPSARKLVSIELVVNIIAAIGGDCARKSHSVAKRTEKLNVLRNKNSKTISNVRGYGAIRTNSNDGSCFLDVNVFPETAMTVYNTNNRPVIIFHYDDNTQAIQSEANTEKFWRKVFHTSEETVIPNINPTLKVDLPANADVLCERIDAGTIQAVSIKFTNMDKKMFSYYSSDISGRYVVYLKAAGDYEVSLLRDTVETSDNFLNYNGEKGAVNNFAGASKTGRSGNNVAVVARPQVAAAQSNLYGMPSTVEVSKVVEAVAPVAPVAVVIDTEKETLRAENVALKAEVSELKTQIAQLTAGQARMEALMEQLVAAQAVKTEEVSIPEIIEVVDPVAPEEVVETEAEEIARLEKERDDFFHSCQYANFEATGEEALDVDQNAELHAMANKIADLKEIYALPVAERAARIESRRLEREEAAAKNQAAYDEFMTTGKVSANVFM